MMNAARHSGILALLGALAHTATAAAEGEPVPDASETPVDPPASMSPNRSPPPAAAPANHFGFKVQAGPAYRRLYGTSITGADVELAFGGEGRKGGVYFNLGVVPLASTEFGLRANAFELGVGGELIWDRLRLGGGIQMTYLQVSHATFSGHTWGLGPGFHVLASLDVVQFDGHAMFLSAKFNGDYLGGEPSAYAWGPTGLLGFRY